MTPPCSDAGADLPIWGLEANGQYSVSSGYLIACEIDDDSDNRWKEIWRWERRITNVGWKAAEQQFATLNTDGSVRGRRGGAAAGGCMRNEEGRIIDAFACNLGRCSITRAELTGAVIGLERAWELGERKVEVQMDSSCAIKLLEGKLNLEHQHAGLVLRFKQLTERSWTIRLIFTGKVITWQIIWQTKVMI
ncbi:Putative ribonuclease H protein At1g65750 [Linum perenne]